MLRRVLQPSLLRTLLVRSLLVAVVPLVLLGFAVTYVTDQVILQRFQEESELVAKTTGGDVQEFVVQTTRFASLISEIQQTKQALASRDPQVIKAQLLPLKSRLGLEVVNFADNDGVIIAGAQDPQPGEKIPDDLLARGKAQVEQAWVIATDPARGLVLRVIAPVRQNDDTIGYVEVATPLDTTFLRSVQRGGLEGQPGPLAPQLALVWEGDVRASTLDDAIHGIPTADQIDNTPTDELVGQGMVGDTRYHAIYTLIETHKRTLLVLAVLTSLEPVESAHRIIFGLVLIGLVLLVGAIALYSYRSAEGLTRPLRNLVQAAQRIQAGDLSARIEQRAAHEIGALEGAFDTMAHALEQREQSNRELVAELQVQALNDSLTSLPNRILFQDRLRQQIYFSSRQGSRFALFVIDLDRFKEVNDTFGHQTGDRLLVTVGERIRSTLRESDTVARFGGDEFALLIPTADSEERAVTVARKIQKALEGSFTLDGFLLNVEGSVGITMFPEHGEDPQTLIKRADAAMYVAKRNKSGYAMYEPSEELESRDRLILMGEFRQAIERDELVLHYQPEVEPRSGEIIAVEALVRWRHPTRGLLFPDQFIPFAEQTGLIRPLTHHVLDTAVRQIRSWRSRSGRPIHVAVNLSARDFQDPELPDFVDRTLRRWEMPPEQLKLEITETVVMADAARSLETLSTLREMGVQLSIDDFGTGYSSLSYLKRLPVDEIKIDRSFVTDIVADQGASAIVRATIDLAHSLDRTVVAEGAEDQATMSMLAVFGCDAVQGYYFAKPLPAEEIEKLVVGIPPWVTRGRLMDLQVVEGGLGAAAG
jgi:diguanylate cyclase (GGDEF)-like protein